MSSLETLRDHPCRLSAAAYAPYGTPIDLPPVWDGPPLSSLTRMTAGSSLANYVTAGSSQLTPPPAYSDDGGEYDRHVFFDDDEEDGYEDEDDLDMEMAIIESRNQGIDYYDLAHRLANVAEGEVSARMNIHDIADRVNAMEIEATSAAQDPLPATAAPRSSTGIDVQDLTNRFIVAASSTVEDAEESASDIEVSASALSSPEVIKSSAETPELHEEGWSFPSPRIRKESLMRARTPLPGATTLSRRAENRVTGSVGVGARPRAGVTSAQQQDEVHDMREMYRLMTGESERARTPPIPRRPTGQVPRLIAPFIQPTNRPLPPRYPLEMVRTHRLSEISPNQLSTTPASAPAAISLSRLKPLPPLPHNATYNGMHHHHQVLGPRARHLAPETPFSRSQPAESPLRAMGQDLYRL